MSTPNGREWRFLTSHAFVLLQIARSSRQTVREIAEGADLTERQTHRILDDLVDAGYVTRRKEGRRNSYQLDTSRPLVRGNAQSGSIAALLTALTR